MLHQPIHGGASTLHFHAQPKVYSYARWSTDEQAKGDSLRRQLDAAERWARARGLELDAKLSFRDEGVSAFRGRNAAEGGLGAFLEACRRGLVNPGSYLLVESLDRLSRLPPRQASRILDDIVDAGVTVVTLSDNQEFTAERLTSDPTALLISLMVSWRAHEESKTKGRRLASAWAEKRRKVRAGEAQRLTRQGPSWLCDDGEGWTVDEAKAAIVHRIYAMTLAGMGEHKIAATLNSEAVPVMGRGKRRGKQWHRSMISKLLRNPSVIGTLIPGQIEHGPNGRLRVLEAPIPNAFPAVIKEADWLAVRALKDGKAAAVRGRHAGRGVAHVLAGLAKCPECGATMSRVNKGNPAKGGLPKLVCSAAKGKAGCRYVSVHVAAAEGAFLDNWGALFADIPAGGEDEHLDRAYRDLESAIMGTEDHLQDLANAWERAPSTETARRVAKVEAELRSMRAELEELDERRRMADRGLIHARMDDLGELLRALEEGQAELDRTAINTALKVLFTAVVVDYRTGHLRFQWRRGGEASLVYAWVD